jgi:membrane protease YdiL (CAAX protease family)
LSQLQLSEGFSFSYGFVPVLLLLLLAAVFEELGWRGYAFDSLEQRYSYLTASILFGIIWSLWHAPLIFVNNSYQYEIMHQNIWYGINFFVGTVILGIIVSWVCSKNRKSIIAAIAFHFIINISQEALAITQTTKCIETVVLAGVALALIVIDRDLFFSKKSLVDTPSN